MLHSVLLGLFLLLLDSRKVFLEFLVLHGFRVDNIVDIRHTMAKLIILRYKPRWQLSELSQVQPISILYAGLLINHFFFLSSAFARAGRVTRVTARATRIVRFVKLVRIVRVGKLYKHAFENINRRVMKILQQDKESNNG